MEADISIALRTDDVLELCGSESFREKWARLAATTPHATVLQEPDFVLSWYRTYAATHDPVLVTCHDDAQELAGLIPLAVEKSTGAVCHAGGRQAEYHGWLCRKEIEVPFLARSLPLLGKRFNLEKWEWGWLPPGSGSAWLESETFARNGVHVSVESQDSPLLDLNDSRKIRKLFKNKANKNQINRFRKREGFRVERIRDHAKLADIFDVLIDQYEFRKMAIHGSAPFHDDPLKKGFCLERAKATETSHITVLYAEGEPVAFHFGMCDEDTLYLGLSSYDPLEGKNSPGKVLFLFLIELARAEGLRFIDLTPGGDAYKEQFCSTHQPVRRPTFYFSPSAWRKHRIEAIAKQAAKKGLAACGLSPAAARSIATTIANKSKKIRKISFQYAWSRLSAMAYADVTYNHYRYDLAEYPEQEAGAFPWPDVNRFRDLFKCSHEHNGRHSVISKALTQFANGENLFSMSNANAMKHYGWMARGGRKHFLSDVDTTYDSPEGSVVLYDFYTDPRFRGEGLYTNNLRAMLAHAKREGAATAYIGALETNGASNHVIAKVGFTRFATYRKKRILFWTRYDRSSNDDIE